MKRIALVLTDLEIGGTPAVVRELAVRLKQRAGAHVEVVGLSPPGPLREQLLALGVKCTALGARGARDLVRTAWRLARLLRQERIETVLSFLVHANAVAGLARLLYPRGRWLQSIQTTQPWPRWHWALQRLVAPAADRIIVPSPSVAQVARRWSGIPPGKILVIPNAVEAREFEGCETIRRGGGAARIGFIGRLDPVKRVPDLLEAVACIDQNTVGPVQLHIYGEGRDRARIEETLARLGLQGRAHLHGAIARPQEALAQIDLLMLPSEAEGFGLVLIEAMAAGVPVVATNVPGIRDVVRDGENGILVPPRSPGALREAIVRVLRDRPLREALIERGRRDVAHRFSWDAVWGRYAEALGLGHGP